MSASIIGDSLRKRAINDIVAAHKRARNLSGQQWRMVSARVRGYAERVFDDTLASILPLTMLPKGKGVEMRAVSILLESDVSARTAQSIARALFVPTTTPSP